MEKAIVSGEHRPATPIGRVFADGPIEILVTRVWGQQVSLGITAHAELVVCRWSAHILDAPRQVELLEFAQCGALDIDESSHASQPEQSLGVGVLERPDLYNY